MKAIDFSGKTAVLTGAASGMGLCAARELVKLGASVVMCDISADALEDAVAEINAAAGRMAAFACVSDVRKFADAQKAADLALEKTERIDILVPFAGGYEARMCNSYVPFYEQPIDVIDWGLDVNLKGAVYFARAAVRLIARQNDCNPEALFRHAEIIVKTNGSFNAGFRFF